jgi:hypothetical protein
MKGINRDKKTCRNGKLKSSAIHNEIPNVFKLIVKSAYSFMLKSTPMWPISEENKENIHSIKTKNVCSTFPILNHKSSRLGKEWPAKGSISGSQIMDLSFKAIKIDNRKLIPERHGDRQSTVILLPRCRMMFCSLNPERPHSFFKGVKTLGAGRAGDFAPHLPADDSFSACTNSPSCTGKIEKVAVLVN